MIRSVSVIHRSLLLHYVSVNDMQSTATKRVQSREDMDTFLCLFGDDLVDMLSDEVS